MLDAEVAAGAGRFEKIMNNWLESEDKHIAHELQSLITQQKQSCLAMVDEKEKLVRELLLELTKKDNQYVKYLKRQASDIDLILERMEAQANMLLKGHQEELMKIEKAYDQERRELIEYNKMEWEKLTKKRSEKEKKFLEDRDKRVDQHETDCQNLRVKNMEDFNLLKIKLETDIQSLQQQIQQMKATFQLNTEKLEYNLQVLKKRDEENTVTISQQKRRMTRLQDTLTHMQTKLNKQEKACKSEILLLVDDYRKNTEQYKELQKKVKHFQTIDTKRFHDIWKMNEKSARELASEILGADDIIHRQQLGQDYTPPPAIDSPLKKVLQIIKSDKDVSRATLYASKVVAEAGNTPSATSETLGAAFVSPVPYYPLVVIKQVLELLCKECEFLMEDKLLHLLAQLGQEEQMMMKLDSIFKAISVENEVDIHQLIKYFLVEKSEESSFLQPKKDESRKDVKAVVVQPKPVLIHPNLVLSQLKIFVKDRQGIGADSSFLSKEIMQNLYKDLLDGSFWSQLANIVPESSKIWDALTEVRHA